MVFPGYGVNKKTMPQLHETMMGQKLISTNIPGIHHELKRIADLLETLVIMQGHSQKAKDNRGITLLKPGSYVVTIYGDVWNLDRDRWNSNIWRGVLETAVTTKKVGASVKAATKRDALLMIEEKYK
jgi:hypothetical protein